MSKRLSALAQLVALYAEAKGITSTAELARLTGRCERQIWRAKAEFPSENTQVKSGERRAPISRAGVRVGELHADGRPEPGRAIPGTTTDTYATDISVSPPDVNVSLTFLPPSPQKKGLPHTPSKENNPPTPFQLTSFVESSGKPDKRPKEATEPAAQEALQREFQLWYSTYPRREARGRAERAYRTARKSIAAETLLAGAQQAAKRWAAPCERQFTPLPASWLNGQRWLDEWAPSGPTRPNGKQYDPEFLRLMGVVQ